MAKPLDHDLRIRIVAAAEGGMSRYRATGSVAPDQMGGHRRPILEAERDWVMARIAEQPDVTTRALADELAERGIVVSHVSVWNLLRREKQRHKKNLDRQRAEPS